ncbi:hypothetical protein PRNP1_011949 [Phytophthora ramorum]
MDAILSRLNDAELRQHCEAAVLDELQKANSRVQDVVVALQRAVKVAQASRELHKTLVLNASEQVQASFRHLGDSCNQIGPLLRILHHTMASATSGPVAASVAAAVPHSGTKPSPDAASSTASEYELPSDEDDDDDEPEVVEVSPPKSRKKRKAAALDLSESPTPAVRRKIPEEDAQTVRDKLEQTLWEIQAIPTGGYSVTAHKEFASLVKRIFTTDKFDDWQPRDDPKLGLLLDEMDNRIAAFKESTAQNLRIKALGEWLEEMTASSFVPTLDFASIPPMLDSSSTVPGCENAHELHALTKSGSQVLSKLRGDTSNPRQKKQRYFQPLLEATTKFFAAAAVTKTPVLKDCGAGQCNNNLRMLSGLVKGVGITRKECKQLEELLHLVRLVMRKNKSFRKKAVSLVADLLKVFPWSARPNFCYPKGEADAGLPEQTKEKKSTTKEKKKKKH